VIQSGVDIVKIARIERMTRRFGDRFIARVLNETERMEMSDTAHYLAGRFAAKEAVAKAIGTGVWRCGVSFTDLEIRRDKRGRPQVTLYGAAKDIFESEGGRRVSVSISHDGEYAVAFAAAEYMKP
jgi:holo-[acyl-carrier protein] synthase